MSVDSVTVSPERPFQILRKRQCSLFGNVEAATAMQRLSPVGRALSWEPSRAPLTPSTRFSAGPLCAMRRVEGSRAFYLNRFEQHLREKMNITDCELNKH